MGKGKEEIMHLAYWLRLPCLLSTWVCAVPILVNRPIFVYGSMLSLEKRLRGTAVSSDKLFWSGYCGKRLCVMVPKVKGLQTGCGAVGFPGMESSEENVGLGRPFSISRGEYIDIRAGF